MNSGNVLAALLAAALFLAGCMTLDMKTELPADQVNVFGVQMGSDTDYRRLNGVDATEEPCLHGYERSFDTLDVAIGYGFDKRIRKIVTRNPVTSIFSIRPGMTLEEGTQRVTAAGFREQSSPYLYCSGSYSLKLLIDNERIAGLVLERID